MIFFLDSPTRFANVGRHVDAICAMLQVSTFLAHSSRGLCTFYKHEIIALFYSIYIN